MKYTKKIFVYGTLKTGGIFAFYFDKFRLKVEKARIKGKLYDLGGFPGLILCDNDSYVYGEIHEYSKPNVVISHMDIIEGYSEHHEYESDNLYKRIIVEAEDENKAIVNVITYVLAHWRLTKMVKEGHFPKVEIGKW